MKFFLRMVAVTLFVIASNQVLLSQSSFSTAKIDDGDGCNWPFSSTTVNPNDGNIYTIWRDGGGTGTIKLIKWTGSSWTSVGSFTHTNMSASLNFDRFSDYISMDIDASGNFHVVFGASKTGSCCSQPRGFAYAYSSNGTSWSFETIISYTDPSGWKNISDPSIKVDKNGVPHVGGQFTNSNNSVSFMGGTYNRLYTVKYFKRTGASTWAEQTPFFQGGASNEVNSVSMALDTNGRPHFAFQAETNGSGLDGSLCYTYWTGSAWSTMVKLITGNGSSSPFTYEYEGAENDIEIDPVTNKVYIVSYNYQATLKLTTNSSGSFSTSTLKSNGNCFKGGFNITSNGDKFVGYWDGSASRLKALVQPNGSSWTTSSGGINPSGGGYFPSAYMTDAGEVMFLYDVPPSGSCGSTNARQLWYGTGTASVGCSAPSTPTISLSPSTICSGSSTTVSVTSGSLNGATSWKAYSGANGTGTSYGTLTGGTPSLSISPSATGTVYVRGEGCPSAGADGSASITVNSPNTGSNSITACDSYTWDGTTYTTSGAKTKTYTNAAGCDSVHTLNLTINNSNTGSHSITSCDSYTWDGTTYTTSGAKTKTYTNAAGCDSVHTLNLTINNSNTGSHSITACDSYTWDGTTYTSGGAKIKTYTNAAGCDSVHTLNLTINNSNTGSHSITACDSYTWDGTTYTSGGAKTKTYTNAAGCDSVHTLNLTINNSNTGSHSITACDSYTWDGTTYTTSGAKTKTYTNAAGCDSLHTLNLTINNSNTGSHTVNTCNSYTWDGTTYTASTVDTKTYTNAAGCDSVHTLNLTIRYESFATISPDVCDTYTSPSGKTWTSSGTYMDTIPNDAGCDSIITVNLTVRYSTTSSLTVREFNSYTAPSGAVYTQSAVVNDVITNDAGCDSTITIDIEIVNIVFVDGDKSTSGNGKTWATAHNTIDEAIDSANINPNTVEIWVKKGTYYPGGSQSTTDRKSSFIITNINTLLYGGFVGNETLSSQRNPALNPTILSGNIGSASDSTDNVFHIMLIIDKRAYVSGEAIMDEDFIVDGFTFMDGYAIGPGKDFFEGEDLYQSEGSAIAIISSGSGRVMRPTISNCHFERNTSVYGSIFMGVEQGNSFATINNCTFKSNHATHGAIYNESNFGETSPTIKNCVFEGNISKASGGAIFNYSYTGTSSPTIENCVFIGNTAQTQGAAIYNNGYVGTCKPNIINCTFYGNAATVQAGAIYNFGLSGTLETKITNCVFYKNTKGGISTDRHSELYNYQSTNTINNSSLQNASSLYNSANKNGVNGGTGNVFATYPDFVDTTDFDGADDLFRTADDGLSIKSTSSLVNAGKTAGAPTNDIIGNQRTTTVDIGAYEYITCGLSSPLATSVATHTATQSAVDNGFVCYCNSNNKLLLALDTNGTGAVITPSQVKLYIGNPSTLSYNSAGGMITNTAGGVILERRWDVDPTTQPTSPVRVRYFYTNDEYDDIVTAMAALTSPTTITSPSQLQFYKVTGGSTATFPNPHDAGVTGIVLTNGATASTTVWVNGSHGVQDHTAEYLVSSFSGGGGGGGGGSNPLPVELIHFDAQASANHTAEITWKTASELDNSHFVVERSYNARDFEEVAIVQGNGTTQNTISYSHNDNTIDQTQNLVFYRLRQVDFDGTQAYSPIRRVDFVGDITPNKVSLYPNPTNGQVTVRFEDDEVLTHSVKVIDNLGRELYNNTFEGQAIQLDLSSQATGIYFIILDTGESFKVVKE